MENHVAEQGLQSDFNPYVSLPLSPRTSSLSRDCGVSDAPVGWQGQGWLSPRSLQSTLTSVHPPFYGGA